MLDGRFRFILNTERTETFLNYLRQGYTQETAANLIGTSRGRIYEVVKIGEELIDDWDSRNYEDDVKKAYVKFVKDYNEAKGELSRICTEVLLEAIKDPNTDQRVRIDNAKWLLTHINGDFTNNKKQLDISVSQKGLLEDAVKSKEEMLADMEDTLNLIDTNAKVKESDEDKK